MKKGQQNNDTFGSDKCNIMFRIEYDAINEELHFGDPMI